MAKSALGNFDPAPWNQLLSLLNSFRKRKVNDRHTDKKDFIEIGKHILYSSFIFFTADLSQVTLRLTILQKYI